MSRLEQHQLRIARELIKQTLDELGFKVRYIDPKEIKEAALDFLKQEPSLGL